jgi:hypothetical protein
LHWSAQQKFVAPVHIYAELRLPFDAALDAAEATLRRIYMSLLKREIDKVTPAIQDRRFITAYRRSPKASQLRLDVWI